MAAAPYPYLTPEELAAELEARKCRFIKDGPNNYRLWESHTGEPFSVPPPQELIDGDHRYPGWFLADLIRELGLPAKSVSS
jgi:hypothetical protein